MGGKKCFPKFSHFINPDELRWRHISWGCFPRGPKCALMGLFDLRLELIQSSRHAWQHVNAAGPLLADAQPDLLSASLYTRAYLCPIEDQIKRMNAQRKELKKWQTCPDFLVETFRLDMSWACYFISFLLYLFIHLFIYLYIFISFSLLFIHSFD